MYSNTGHLRHVHGREPPCIKRRSDAVSRVENLHAIALWIVLEIPDGKINIIDVD